MYVYHNPVDGGVGLWYSGLLQPPNAAVSSRKLYWAKEWSLCRSKTCHWKQETQRYKNILSGNRRFLGRCTGCVYQAQERGKLRDFVSRAIKLGVTHNVANFLTSWETISFWRWSPMRGISQDFCLYSVFLNYSISNIRDTKLWSNKFALLLERNGRATLRKQLSEISRRLIFRGHRRFYSQKWHFSDGHNDV